MDNVYTHLLTGLGAGLLAGFIGSPVDVVKSRMLGDSTYKSTFDCFLKTLLNGLKSRMMGDSTYKSTFDCFVKTLLNQDHVGLIIFSLSNFINCPWLQIFWAFTIYLEAVAILPQLVLLQRSRNVDNLTVQYVFFLGAYRAFYILNWIYRYLTEPRFTRCLCLRCCSDSFVCRFLLLLLHQLEKQFKTEVACMNYLEVFSNLDPCDQSLLNFTERG